MDPSEQFEKYYTKVLKFLSYRPRSEKEIRDYLTRKKVEENIAKIVIKTLHEQKFIDDKEFARMWIDSRVRFNPKSQRVLKMELKQKGISQELIDNMMVDNEGQKITDETLAYKIVEQKITRYKNLPKEELFQKLAGQLGRRGFGWDTIKKVLKDRI